jgi:hypothetical protein
MHAIGFLTVEQTVSENQNLLKMLYSPIAKANITQIVVLVMFTGF